MKSTLKIYYLISAKKLEGRSERTLSYYKATIEKLIQHVDKDVRSITTDDIRRYLSFYEDNSRASKTSIDNIRRNFSSFFNWLEDENYVLKSPVRRIHKIKTTAVIKDAYFEDEMERFGYLCMQYN